MSNCQTSGHTVTKIKYFKNPRKSLEYNSVTGVYEGLSGVPSSDHGFL